MTAPILSIRGLHKVYADGTHALRGVDLDVREGEFVVLVGLSGSGKSTLLRCLNRLVEPTQGSIGFEGEDVLAARGEALRRIRRRIGMIFQQFNLVRNLSVLTNVLTGRLGYVSFGNGQLLRRNRAVTAEARQCLARVGLEHLAGQTVRNLSGGQQQRVAIARALMQRPRLILADEPVASLDPATADSVLRHLGDLNRQEHITVICSLHFLSLARKYGSRVLALKDGAIVFDGLPADIDDERFRAIYGEDAEEVEIR